MPVTGERSDRIPVVVIHAHGLARDGLCMLVGSHPGLCLAGVVGSAAEAHQRLAEADAPVVAVERDLPDGDGATFVAAWRRGDPRRRAVAIGGPLGGEWIGAMIRAGAIGCVSKASHHRHLVRALLAAHAGERYLCPGVLDELVPQLGRSQTGPPPDASPLSPREREVARGLASGHHTKRIAAALGISVKTVETHRRNLMAKLGADSIAAVVHFAIRHRLVELGAADEIAG